MKVSSPASTSWKGKGIGTNIGQRNWYQHAGEGLGKPWQPSETGKQHPAEGFTGPPRPHRLTSLSKKNESFNPTAHVHQHARLLETLCSGKRAPS